jgi:YD repeat-containing protein
MQHIKNLTAAFIILSAVVSCKKERTSAPPVAVAEKRIVQEANITSGDTTRYSYNEQGKVIKVETANNYWQIEYLPSMIKVSRKRIAGNVFLGIDEYSTDASGKMTSSVSKTPNGTVTSTCQYEYDAAGYMIGQKEIYASGDVYEDVLTNPAGNPVTVKSYWNGALDDVTDYYFNADVKNKGLGTTLVTTYGIKGFAGKVQEREISELKRYNPAGVLTQQRITTFTTDAQKNITKYKAVYPLTGMTYDYDVSYE